MPREDINLQAMRVSLASSLKWASLGIALYTLSIIFAAGQGLSLADPGTWMQFIKTCINYGILPLIAIVFCELSCYFDPDSAKARQFLSIASRASLAAAFGYLLMIPLSLFAALASEKGGLTLAAMASSVGGCVAMAIGYAGVGRTKYFKTSPLDSWPAARRRHQQSTSR